MFHTYKREVNGYIVRISRSEFSKYDTGLLKVGVSHDFPFITLFDTMKKIKHWEPSSFTFSS